MGFLRGRETNYVFRSRHDPDDIMRRSCLFHSMWGDVFLTAWVAGVAGVVGLPWRLSIGYTDARQAASRAAQPIAVSQWHRLGRSHVD